MPSRRPRSQRALLGHTAGAASLALLVGTGCYAPTIGDGAFRCGPGGLCPEGYSCDTKNACVTIGAQDLGTEGKGPIFSGALGAIDLTGRSGTLECSTKTGEISLRDGTSVTQIVPPAANGFARAQQTGGPPIASWSFERWRVPAEVTVRPASDSDALAVFAAVTAIELDGSIDWRGYGGFGGLSGRPGAAASSGVSSGGQPGTGDDGGGGGGHAAAGSVGLGVGGGAGGMPYGAPQLVPVHVGSGGGGGGGGRGGNGGGSVVLLSQGSVSIKGKIDVSGNAGADALTAGGGGGGSGGSLLVSGASVVLGATHELLARGGAGGGGLAPGMGGGAGSPGRIWIGGALTTEVALTADPAPTQSAATLTTFPQP